MRCTGAGAVLGSLLCLFVYVSRLLCFCVRLCCVGCSRYGFLCSVSLLSAGRGVGGTWVFLDGPLFEAEMRYFLEFDDFLIAFVDEVVSEREFLSVFLSAGVDVFSGADYVTRAFPFLSLALALWSSRQVTTS